MISSEEASAKSTLSPSRSFFGVHHITMETFLILTSV